MTPGSDLPRGSWKTEAIPDPSLSDPDRNQITRLLRAETDTGSDELRCLVRMVWPEKFAPPRLIQLDHRTDFRPAHLSQDLFWPTRPPEALKPQTGTCPGCGSRKLTPTGSCAHCGTQRTAQSPERKIVYIDVADMSTEEAAATIGVYRGHLKGDMPVLPTPTRGQWMTR